MILLNKVATQAKKDRWLQPIIDGKVRSAFAMTEPAPGAGSDPSTMLTTGERMGDRWIIRGRKWFIVDHKVKTTGFSCENTPPVGRCGMEYRHGSHTVFQIEYQFVWVTKYRYKVLSGEVAERVRELVRETCEAFEVRIVSVPGQSIGI
ncbi:hypothetical protein R69658_08272 [Paraburkholderia aspalathi]|uniref:Transposase IS200-like domain-containing protein n=1 Tax=Paraburkholderia aspalathi TaxID=1324617 RepID=A0ABN7NE59_9BURK|nr:hypothetical protein R69658_08272 [Paraburkholderia aspalathi]